MGFLRNNSWPSLARLACAGGVGCLTALGASHPAAAGGAGETVGTIAEAWYYTQTAPACTAPVGCAEPVPSEGSTYPPGTLHVGSLLGQPTSHAYVQLDLAGLPIGAQLVSGTLSVPVSQDPQAGNASVETAKLTACLVTTPITDGVEGGTATSPKYDCDAAQSPVKAAKDAKSFTLDLKPFAAAWSGGAPDNGIALVPAAEQEPGVTWHVSFNGKESEVDPKISAKVTYQKIDDIGGGIDPGESATPPIDAAGPEVGSGEALGPDLSAPENAEAPAAAPDVAPQKADEAPQTAESPRAQPARLVNTTWYGYPGVIYLPLAFLIGMILIARALTRPLTLEGGGSR